MTKSVRFSYSFLIMCIFVMLLSPSSAQNSTPKPPIMGWSSWNHYHIDISEEIIKAQAKAMASNGMKEVGYSFINIDDGYFGGRDAAGNLLYNHYRFPHGMKKIADYIHKKGLKAGIYTDAGSNTCGYIWQGDNEAEGCGLFGHDTADIKRFFDEWGYDFLKVDWCGAERLGLDEETRYTEIGRLVRQIKPDAVYNVCRWQFPGEWVIPIADSWRISGDITNTFQSICEIIDLNADNWRYCTAGHYNDMDMLQVGRGMTYEEDKAHFTLWCAMVSPLLAGNDLTNMSDTTLSILTNREIIALNQDPLYYQARRLRDDGDLELWAKPLGSIHSGEVAVVLFNRSKEAAAMNFKLKDIGLAAAAGYTMRDLWTKQDYETSTEAARSFIVPAHGVVALKVTGKVLPNNVFEKE